MSIEVGVGGVGMHPFGRFDDAGLVDLGVTAVQQAMTEAGIGPGGFKAAYCGTAYGGVATGHRVLGALALTGTPIIDVEAGCASGGAALRNGPRGPFRTCGPRIAAWWVTLPGGGPAHRW